MSSNESWYKVSINGTAATLTLEKGPDLNFTAASINLTLPLETTLAIPPALFKLVWIVPEASKLHHKLSHVEFHHTPLDTRYVLPLPEAQPLEGSTGEVPFSTSVPSGFIKWAKVAQAGSTWARLYFRPISTSRDEASSEVLSFGAITQHAQNNVVFVFPSQDDTAPRLLWSKSATLAKSSPWFKDVFNAPGWAETSEKIQAPQLADKSLVVEKKKQSTQSSSTVSTGKEKAAATEEDKEEDETILNQSECEDSDMETDSFPSPTSSPSIHRFTITEVAYRTLFSYLYYLETGIINFSPLTSLLPTSYVPNSSLSSTSVPTCSPKSMYRLSSFDEHQALKELSYTSISSQLDSRNALTELFSDLASDYEEIKSVCTQAVLDNWSFVKDSKEMKEVEREMKEGRLEERKVEKVFELFGKLKPVTA